MQVRACCQASSLEPHARKSEAAFISGPCFSRAFLHLTKAVLGGVFRLPYSDGMFARTLLFFALLPLLAAASRSTQPMQVRLSPMNGSGLHGIASLTPRGSGLVVTIVLYGTAVQGGARFAHFHRGTCERVSSPAMYVLEPVRNGRSTTRLPDVGLEQLVHGTYSVLIHASLSHASPHVACGTIAGV